MKPRPKIPCRLTLAGMLLVAGCAVGLAPRSAQAEPEKDKTDAGKLAARVNGRPIYEAQLKPQLDAVLQRFRKYGMRRDNAALVQRQRRRILDRLIGEELISQASQKLSANDIDQRVDREVKALQTKYGAGEQFEKYLKSRKLARKDLKESLRAKARVAEYLKSQGISEPEIPEARIRSTYEKNPKDYSRRESIKVSHILIAAQDDSDPVEIVAARQKAQRIRQQILAGEDFSELAKKHSNCNSASGGGDLRYIKKGYMPAEFDQVAFAMESCAVSEVVKTKFGFHIIKVLDKRPAGVMPYREVRELIKRYLQEEESKKKLAAHIAELRGKAKIEILPEQS